jgi:hypothetical protein
MKRLFAIAILALWANSAPAQYTIGPGSISTLGPTGGMAGGIGDGGIGTVNGAALGPGGGGGAGPPFTPASLANLLAWYKADAGVFSDAGITPATDGQTVTQWNDQSGNGNNLTATAKPTFNTAVQNGLPAIHFTGQTTWMQKTGLALGGTTLSVFMVSRWIANLPLGTNNGRFISFSVAGSDTTATTAIAFYSLTTGNQVQTYNNAPLSTAVLPANTWARLGTVFNGVNDTMYLNNVAQTPVAATPTFAATIDLGVSATAGGAQAILESTMAEIIIVKGAVTVADRANIDNYLLRWFGTGGCSGVLDLSTGCVLLLVGGL